MKRQHLYNFIFGALSILFLLPTCVRAQSHIDDYAYSPGNPTFGVNYPISGGYVNVANGNAHLTIPLGTFKQRGNLPAITVSLEYDSRIWQIIEDPFGDYSWQPTHVALSTMGGWRLTTGVENPVSNSSFSIGANQNGPYTCNGTSENGDYIKYSDFVWTDSNGTLHTFDASVIQPASGPACASTGTGYAIDGSGYYLSISGNSTMTVYDPSGVEVFPWYEDGNGNQAVADFAGNVTDSMGRALVTTNVSGDTTTYTVLKEGGGTNTFTAHTETINANTLFQQSAVTEFNGSFTVITSIDLPDGSSYSFNYDSGTNPGYYGELQSMTVPTGGVVNLYYTNYLDSYKNENRWIDEETENGGNTLFNPQVITECQDDDTVDCQEQVTVTRPSQDSRVYALRLNNGAWNTQMDTYTGAPGSTKLMTTSTSYNFGSYNCTDPSICTGAQFIKASTNTVELDDTSQTALTQYIYSKPWTAKVDTIEYYDYGATGTPSRQTDYTYGNTLSNGVSLLSQVEDERNTNGSLVPFSKAQYAYDGNGNLSCETDGLSSSPAVTTYTYNSNGMRISMTDPKGNQSCTTPGESGHTTTYAYSPTCSYGYLSQTTYPSTNGISHITKVNPDCSSGQPLTTTDQNNQVTTYSYDTLGRISSITYPDTGVTSFSYPSANEVVQSKLITGSTSSTLTTTVDAYGRKGTVTQSDPGGDDTITYSYDSDGRLAYTYNPQRTTSSPTDGYTFTNYDALDRPSFIDPPSGNRINITYSGNSATVTDENGNQKKYGFNAFQDLTQVFEPNSSGVPSWETDYTYSTQASPNTHTITITQNGDGSSAARVRTFTYDDLNRLIGESTPEASTKSYSYDVNGNVTGQTDARSDTISYTYDALNRVLTKTGTGLNNHYIYDSLSGISTQNNTIGRLVQETNNVNADEVYSYDVMGRLNWEASLTPSSPNHTGIIIQATYDLAGDMTSLTYPDGRVVQYSYDSAQHLTGAQYASWNGTSVGTSYYSATGFAPGGQVTNATYGNGVQMLATYNPRQMFSALSYQNATQVLWSKQYAWGPNGQNLLQMADMVNPVQSATYTYDPENRLTSVSQTSSSSATAGSAIVTINGSEQSGTSGTYTEGSASTTAQMTGQGTDTETGVPATGFQSVSLGLNDAVSVTTNIAYNIQTDLGTGIGKGGVAYQYSTDGGTTWTSFYSQTPVNNNINYGPQNVSFGPISGLTNLNQLLLRVQATAQGLGSDSGVLVNAYMANSGSTTATVAGYDSGTVTVTVNGHGDSANFQAGSTASTVASALVTAINNDGSAPVTASASGSQLTLTSKVTGTGSNYPVSVSWTNNSGSFPNPSFTASAPVSLSGGTAGGSNPNALNETYTIDPWGNMQQSGNFNFTQSFSTNNQISGTGYSYDAAGNLLTDGNGNTYTYNAEGKLNTNNGLQYIYDALGQWVSEGSAGSSEMIYFGGRQIAFHLPNGSYLADLIWAGNTMVAMVPGSQTANPVYRLIDNVGTLAMFTDTSGNPGGTNLLSPFGQWITHTAGDLFPFAGLLGLTNNNFHAQTRDYDPVAARWLTPDAYSGSYDLANPQSFNRYMYVNGNPLAFTDPSGQYVWSVCSSGSCNFGNWFPPVLGPILSSVGIVLDFADLINDIFGLWGQPPQFTGNVQASQTPKNVPDGNNSNNIFKHYGSNIPCTSSAEDVMDYVESSFTTFGNYSRWGGLESVTFMPPAAMSVGSTIPINIGVAGIFRTLSVNIQSLNAQSMTFTTNPGHLLYPASITFSATPAAQGAINFDIDLSGTVADPLQFALGGSNFEDAQWNHFLGQVNSFCEEP